MPQGGLLDSGIEDLRTTNILVETGFMKGESAAAALKASFEKVISIEMRKVSVEYGHEKFAEQIESGQLEIVHGKSEEVLAEVIQDIDEPVTFFLDAHLGPLHLRAMSKKEEGALKTHNPLYAELEIIRNHPIKNHVILIDDINRLQGGEDDAKWCQGFDEETIVAKLLKINPNYTISKIKSKAILCAKVEVE